MMAETFVRQPRRPPKAPFIGELAAEGGLRG